LIHIRKYEDGPLGNKIPTKTGATIPIQRLDGFIKHNQYLIVVYNK